MVASGFTTALLGDERTLREFIVADHVRSNAARRGFLPILLLVNDSYDPLDERQLRVGVAKDETLIERFRSFCGRPIAEVPDPYDCHASYSEHFAEALLERLRRLRIHPLLLDTYAAYRRGDYAPYIAATLDQYGRIQSDLAAEFKNFTMRNLLRAQCPKCRCIDATNILSSGPAEVRIACDRCRHSGAVPRMQLDGKLSWKLDCAARWNLYGVDVEVFSKSHLADRSTLGIARLVSRDYFGGVSPEIVPYGEVRIAPELSYRLLEILPPDLLKSLFLGRLRRDLDLTRDYVENFCIKSTVADGISYADYVRRELPARLLRSLAGDPLSQRGGEGKEPLDDPELLGSARAYARFYYGREHAPALPDVLAARGENPAVVRCARAAVQHALKLRGAPSASPAEVDRGMRDWLQGAALRDDAYHFLRRVFRQNEGPRLATVLSLLPQSYLELVDHVLELCTLRPVKSAGHEPSPQGGLR